MNRGLQMLKFFELGVASELISHWPSLRVTKQWRKDARMGILTACVSDTIASQHWGYATQCTRQHQQLLANARDFNSLVV